MAISQDARALIANALMGEQQPSTATFSGGNLGSVKPKSPQSPADMQVAAFLPEMNPIKFGSESEAAAVMSPLNSAGKINGWDITKSGYVRYFDPQARVWRDLVPYDLTRFGR